MDATKSQRETVLGGRYLLKRMIGTGGMAMVLAAEDLTSGERVAVKVLKPEAAACGLAVERFVREARLTAELQSAHVVKVLDTGGLATPLPFLVLELLDGRPLDALLRERSRLAPIHAAEIVRQAALGLACAHAAGIVHRDLKPSNLFVARSAVKLLDFGLAKQQRTPGQAADDLTRRHTMLGTVPYMAPEQLRCARDADARCDVWSFGVVLHELLAGCLPFDGKSLAMLAHRICNEAPVPLRAIRSEVPETLEAIVLQCLDKDPRTRVSSAVALAEALHGVVQTAAPPRSMRAA